MVIAGEFHDTVAVAVEQHSETEESAETIDSGDVACEDLVGGSWAELTIQHVVGECSADIGLIGLYGSAPGTID